VPEADIQQQVQAAQIQQQVIQQTQQGLAQTQAPQEYVRSTSRFTVSTEPSQASRAKVSVDDTTSQSSGIFQFVMSLEFALIKLIGNRLQE
jgi:hypothetical protein